MKHELEVKTNYYLFINLLILIYTLLIQKWVDPQHLRAPVVDKIKTKLNM